MTWDGLTPPYSTIVADPPWAYDAWPAFGPTSHGGDRVVNRPLPYSSMTLDDIHELPVRDLAAKSGAHLYLWTTNRYLEAAYNIVRGWGFKPSHTLVWCKPPMGIGVGGTFSITTEFVIFGRRGSAPALSRVDSTWWQWSRSGHSRKPAGFCDLVEQVSPGPYVELFARQPRLGWDAWGFGHESGAA